MAVQSNSQGEQQLLAEWLTKLPAGFLSKTHVRVGQTTIVLNGKALTPARQRAQLVWSDWMDARVFTGQEVWLIEASIENRANKYGQILWYRSLYPACDDAKHFLGWPIIPLVLSAIERPGMKTFWAGYGIRTVLYQPVWLSKPLGVKLVGAVNDL